MGFYGIDAEPDIDALANEDSFAVRDASASANAESTMTQLRDYLTGLVATTATQLTITAALHNMKTVRISSAAPIAIVLPQATGTGDRYRFVMGVVATGTAHTIKVANATDVMQGYAYYLTTSSDNVIGYKATATDDTISLNGTTKGGYVGDTVEIVDINTGVFQVNIIGNATGSTATPFSATV